MPTESSPRSKPDAWPRGTVPLSVLLALVGVVVAFIGLAQAGDRSSGIKLTTLLAPVVTAIVVLLVMRWYVGRWLGDRHGGVQGAVWTGSIVVAIALFLLARSETLGPPGTSALGGALTGAMIGNLLARRRAARA